MAIRTSAKAEGSRSDVGAMLHETTRRGLTLTQTLDTRVSTARRDRLARSLPSGIGSAVLDRHRSVTQQTATAPVSAVTTQYRAESARGDWHPVVRGGISSVSRLDSVLGRECRRWPVPAIPRRLSRFGSGPTRA